MFTILNSVLVIIAIVLVAGMGSKLDQIEREIAALRRALVPDDKPAEDTAKEPAEG